MNPLCRRALLAVWTLTSIYPYLAHCLTLTVTTKQPYPGGAISIDSTTTSTDPSQANLYIYDTTKQQQTELWTAWPAPESPHSIFTVPSSVTPGTTYVIRATSVDGNTVLANSATFQIFAASAVTSASGSSSSQTSMSSFTTSLPSTTSTTPSTSAPASTSSSSSSASTTPEPSHNSVPIGPIIGGVLGGLALIAVILALLLLFRRRKPAKPTAFLLDKAPPPETFPSQANIAKRDPTVSPFTLTTPPMNDRPPPVMDAKHPAPPGPPSGTFPSGKKGLFGPTPASATSSSGFSSSEKSRLMASASPSASCPDVRIELEELKAQVKTLELQNQAAGLHPLAPPTYQ